MDKASGLLLDIERTIRYLLSGAALTGIWLLAQPRPRTSQAINWAGQHEVLALTVVAAVGFLTYTLYRLLFYFVGDSLAWFLGASAPSLERRNRGEWYDVPYTKFLRWRYSVAMPAELSQYLRLRWAMAHFAVMAGIGALLASFCCDGNSLYHSARTSGGLLGASIMLLGAWEAGFLYRVERDLAGTPAKRRRRVIRSLRIGRLCVVIAWTKPPNPRRVERTLNGE